MEPVRLQPAPEGGTADTKRASSLGELPAVRVECLDDSLFLPRSQRGSTGQARNEHGLAQLKPADPERAQPATQCGQPRLEIRGTLRQIHAGEGFPSGVIGVQKSSL